MLDQELEIKIAENRVARAKQLTDERYFAWQNSSWAMGPYYHQKYSEAKKELHVAQAALGVLKRGEANDA